MSDIFVSYRSDDRDRVAVLVRALRGEGLDVWWDVDIPMGAEWSEAIEAAHAVAKAVVVCWTPASVGSENVREEARRARAEGKLLQVYMEACQPPMFFGELQGAQLVGWSGDRGHDKFRMLVKGLRAVIAGKQPPASMRRQIGYKAPGSVNATALAAAGIGAFAVAGAGSLAIEDVRERVGLTPKVEWSMDFGNGVDLRPGHPPSAGMAKRLADPMLLTIEPVFRVDRAPLKPAFVNDYALTMTIPGEPVVKFNRLYIVDSDEDPETDYHDYVEDAGRLTLGLDDGIKEIMFSPKYAYSWGNFIAALWRATSPDDSRIYLTFKASISANGETTSHEADCDISVNGVLSRISIDKDKLYRAVASCMDEEQLGAPVEDSGAGGDIRRK